MSSTEGEAEEVPAAMRAWGAFLRAHADLVGQMDAVLRAEVGIPLRWYDALAQIAAAGGHVTMRGLEERVLLSQSGLSRLVARLVEAGLVARAVSEDDRRAVELSLTRLGKARLRAARAVQGEQVRELFADRMDDREAVVMLGVLQRLRLDDAPD